MSFHIIRNNIVNVTVDAIVNTANPDVQVGAGCDQDIYEAAGMEQLFAERQKIGPMKRGQVAATPAFDLDAKYIIHAIGPLWRGGSEGEQEIVAGCYRGSLELAEQLGCGSIAFPLLATGVYGFPKDLALRIATDQISAFLMDHEMEVYLVVYDKNAFEISSKIFDGIKEFIGDEDVKETGKIGNRAGISPNINKAARRIMEEDSAALKAAEPIEETETVITVQEDTKESFRKKSSLDERIRHMDKTFQEALFDIIDKKGLQDPQVYKKANIDRKLFSKIRSNAAYAPSKRTAVALAIALDLNLDETKDLLGRAGLALSPSSKFDLIIEYCIMNDLYDIYEINCILFKYDQPLLGA